MAQRYDSISKHIIRGYSEAIAGLVLGNQDVEIEEDLATEQIDITVGHSDVNFKVKLPDGTRAILHIEVQTHDSQEPMEKRMVAYHASLITKYNLPVYGCVIYLHPNAGRTDPGHYAYQWDGGQYLMQYKVIRLIEIDGQAILHAQNPGLLTLSSLMKRREGMEANQWLNECVDAIEAVNVEPQERTYLLGALGILSSLIYDRKQIRQRIPEDIMHEFPIIEQFVQEAKTQGLKQGTIDSILTLLGTRFHPDAVQVLKPNLERIDDLQRLKELLIAASDAQSFEAFAQTLHE